MRKLLIALAAIALLVGCNSSGKKETKSLEKMTITERCCYYFDSMVKAAEAGDRALFYELEADFDDWANGLSEKRQMALMEAVKKWQIDNAKEYRYVTAWIGGSKNVARPVVETAAQSAVSTRSFEKDLQYRKKIAIKRLEDIREIQENYKKAYGQYVSTMESLISFYKEDAVPSLLQIGCKEDSVALMHTKSVISKLKSQGVKDKDIPEKLYQIYLTGDNCLVFTVELKVPVRDRLFCDRLDFCIDSLEFIPFSGGEKVTMDAVIRPICGVNIPLFEACVPYRSLLRGLDQGMVNDLIEEKLDRGLYPGLKVGDIEQPNNNVGNWE